MFLGFLDEGSAGNFLFQLRTSANAPLEPDSAPTWRLYGPAGVVANGTGSAASMETGSVTGATNASPIVVTSASHGLSVGQSVTVTGVGGNTAANGTFVVSAVGSANTFTLSGSTGNGAYTSGGTWKTTGLYKVTLSGSVLSALAAGTTYAIVLYYVESGTTKVMVGTFTVR